LVQAPSLHSELVPAALRRIRQPASVVPAPAVLCEMSDSSVFPPAASGVRHGVRVHRGQRSTSQAGFAMTGVSAPWGKQVGWDMDTASTCSGFSSCSRCSSFEQPQSLGVGPGDVLCVRSGERNSFNLPQAGALFGHILVLLSEPRLVFEGSEDAEDLRPFLPAMAGKRWPLLRARAMESVRSDTGLHQADIFFHMTEDGRVQMIGEFNDDDEWVPYVTNLTELWTAPPELRTGFRADLVAEVVQDMKAVESNWSISTAVRAWLWSASVFEQHDRAAVLQELQECWVRQPICTSIAITFWQRYLSKLAEVCHASVHPAALILRWMPLKADRALPDELLDTLASRGWRQFQQPLFTLPRLLSL